MNGPYTTISRRIIRTGIEHHDARPMSDWQRERSEPRLQPVEHPTLFGCDMPPWCAGILGGAALCIPALYFAGVF